MGSLRGLFVDWDMPSGKAPLADFPETSARRMLDPAAIRNVRPHVERRGAEAAQDALREAGLLPR